MNTRDRFNATAVSIAVAIRERGNFLQMTVR
jgi:hypothetical protein